MTKTILSPEHKASIARARTGKKHSEETKQKMRESQRKAALRKKKAAGPQI